MLLRDIIEEVKREVRARAAADSVFKRISQRIGGVEVNILGTGIGVTTKAQTPASNPLTVWRECLGGLSGVPFVCICIDDAELIETAGLGTLKTLAETSGDVPIILATAGGPELLTRLSQQGASAVARIFSGATFDMEEFKLNETRDALILPIVAAKGAGTWSDEAVEGVHALSHGYPYLVQCTAHSAYHEVGMISAEDVQNSIERALATAELWLRTEIPLASDEDIISFVKLVRTGMSSFRSAQILGLGIQSPYIGRLVKLGVLKKVARGHYDLRKAPVIAYYHSLRRRLKVNT